MIYFEQGYVMRSEQPAYKRQWRDYHTENGARPIKDFLLALPDEDRAAILEEMEYVRAHGTSVARHVRKDIYEVRAFYNTKAYRILFACEGRFHHVLLALEGFQKKTQQTPKAHLKLAEQRLADWRRRGKAKRAGQEN
jgi:phage-related protein